MREQKTNLSRLVVELFQSLFNLSLVIFWAFLAHFHEIQGATENEPFYEDVLGK